MAGSKPRSRPKRLPCSLNQNLGTENVKMSIQIAFPLISTAVA